MKITIQTKVGKKVYTPKESRILIGPSALGATIPLSDLTTFLLEIKREKNRWVIFNFDDNPDLTCNGSPFGVRTLNGPVKLRFGEVAIFIDVPTEKRVYEETSIEAPEPPQPLPIKKEKKKLSPFFLLALLPLLYFALPHSQEKKETSILAARELSDYALLHLFAESEKKEVDWDSQPFVHALKRDLLPEGLATSESSYRIEDLGNGLFIAEIPGQKEGFALFLKEMKLRRVKNLSELKTLSDEEDLMSALMKSEILPLSELATSFPNDLFALPPLVKGEDRHADLYLYNAPRYYKLGAYALKQKSPRAYERLSQKPHFVFLMNGSPLEAAKAKLSVGKEATVAYFSKEKPHSLPEKIKLMSGEEADLLTHTPQSELRALLTKRSEGLSPAIEKLISLLKEYERHPSNDLYPKLEEAFVAFEESDQKESEALFEGVNSLFDQKVTKEKSLTLQQFSDCLDACSVRDYFIQ